MSDTITNLQEQLAAMTRERDEAKEKLDRAESIIADYSFDMTGLYADIEKIKQQRDEFASHITLNQMFYRDPMDADNPIVCNDCGGKGPTLILLQHTGGCIHTKAKAVLNAK